MGAAGQCIEEDRRWTFGPENTTVFEGVPVADQPGITQVSTRVRSPTSERISSPQ